MSFHFKFPVLLIKIFDQFRTELMNMIKMYVSGMKLYFHDIKSGK